MKCPKCMDEAPRTNWRPPDGYDPFLVEYKCSNERCKFVFYEAQGKMLKIQGRKQKLYTHNMFD